MNSKSSPKVFISYTWESMHHVRWVERLAYDLALSGANVTLDRWNVAPGDQLSAFMTSAVKRHDFVLVVCTPKYKRKANRGRGGVAYETDQITAELAATRNHRKFVPILASGTWKTSAPTWAGGKMFVDMRDGENYRSGMDQLRRAIFSEVPEIGPLAQTKITSTVDQSHAVVRISGSESAESPFGGDYILPEVVETQILDLIESIDIQAGESYSMLYCDIDGLLAVNNKFGYEVGDAVMEKVSYLFSFHFMEHDVYRLINRHQRRGGDQVIGIIKSKLEGDGRAIDALQLATDCISSIESFDWSSLAPKLFITVTATVFSAPFSKSTSVPIKVLLADLVESLTSAKRAGKHGLQLLDIERSVDEFRKLETEEQRRKSKDRAKYWACS